MADPKDAPPIENDDAQLEEMDDQQDASSSKYQVEGESAQRLQDVDFATVEVGAEDMLEALAQQANMEIFHLRKVRLKTEVVNLLPEKLSRRFNAIVVDADDESLKIAVSDPFDLDAHDTLGFRFPGRKIEWVLAREDDLRMAIER